MSPYIHPQHINTSSSSLVQLRGCDKQQRFTGSGVPYSIPETRYLYLDDVLMATSLLDSSYPLRKKHDYCSTATIPVLWPSVGNALTPQCQRQCTRYLIAFRRVVGCFPPSFDSYICSRHHQVHLCKCLLTRFPILNGGPNSEMEYLNEQ